MALDPDTHNAVCVLIHKKMITFKDTFKKDQCEPREAIVTAIKDNLTKEVTDVKDDVKAIKKGNTQILVTTICILVTLIVWFIKSAVT